VVENLKAEENLPQEERKAEWTERMKKSVRIRILNFIKVEA